MALYRFPWKLIALDSGEEELYQIVDDPLEQMDLAAARPELAAELKHALDVFPRGESIHLPLYEVLWDTDFFGGKEDRAPWADVVQ
jgi:hypothetical protein